MQQQITRRAEGGCTGNKIAPVDGAPALTRLTECGLSLYSLVHEVSLIIERCLVRTEDS